MLIAYLISRLSRRLRSLDLKREFQRIYDNIARVARPYGRTASRWLLTLYYALTEGELTPKERALTYAAIVYVIIPGDLLPRKVLGLLGVTDDVTALVYVLQKIKKAITPAIRQKAEMKVEEWFGPEIITTPTEKSV